MHTQSHKETLIRHKLSSVLSVFDDNDFNKRGKASRLVTEAQIQSQVVTLKRTYATIIFFWVGSTVSGTIYFVNPLVTSWLGNIGILLCIVIAIISSYSKCYPTLRPHSATATRLTSTVNPSYSTGHGSIQKGSINCILDTTNIGCLLSAVCCCARYNAPRRNFAILPC